MRMMTAKRLRCMLWAAGVFFLLTTGMASAAEIHWMTYRDGVATAKAHHKTLMIFFYADWCPYCKKMKAETLADARVINAVNRDFIAVRVNVDREKDIAREYRVRPIPDTWFVSAEGRPIGNRPGFIPADDLLTILNYMKKPPKPSPESS